MQIHYKYDPPTCRNIGNTCSMAGKNPVLTSPNKGLMTSITAIIWQKYIMSAVVWNVSQNESETRETQCDGGTDEQRWRNTTGEIGAKPGIYNYTAYYAVCAAIICNTNQHLLAAFPVSIIQICIPEWPLSTRLAIVFRTALLTQPHRSIVPLLCLPLDQSSTFVLCVFICKLQSLNIHQSNIGQVGWQIKETLFVHKYSNLAQKYGNMVSFINLHRIY